MPFSLTDADVAILKGLLKDGRKSFRQISRETGISTPTVKARFDRLVNIGFIKSVSPILNIKKGIGIQLKCDFCRGPISGKMHVFKFANFERFFCCIECRSAYKKKYSGRI